MKTLRNLGYINLLAGFPLFYYSFFIGYLALLPLGLVFLALAWVYRTRPFMGPGKQAWLGLLPALGITLGLVGAYAWSSRPFRQTILVPAGYRGLVVIHYDAPDGQPEVWEESSRLIRLSSNGTAATQFTTADQGVIYPENDNFYAVSASGQRLRLPELERDKPMPPNTVGVYHSYVDGRAGILVMIVARADSLQYFLEPQSYSLRSAYTQRVKAIEDSIAPDRFFEPDTSSY